MQLIKPAYLKEVKMNWKIQLLVLVYLLIFNSKQANSDITKVVLAHPKIKGGKINGRWFKNSVTGQRTLRGFDFVAVDGNKEIPLRMIEQNPNKNSRYAEMAKVGSKIAWVIRQDLENGFIGRVQDGQWYKSGYETQAVKYQHHAAQTTPPPTQPMELQELPIVDDAEIPEFVIRALAEVPYDGLD